MWRGRPRPLCGIALERPLSLQKLRLIRPRIDIDQWLTFPNQLTFLVMHLRHHAHHFTGNRGRINRRHGSDRFQINSNISFLRGGFCNRDRACDPASGSSRSGFVFVMVAQYQNKDDRQGDQRERPYQIPPPLGLLGITCRRQASRSDFEKVLDGSLPTGEPVVYW